jgi:hypothetical protein
MPKVQWEMCSQYFKADGTLRDIYIHRTTIEDWRTILDMLRANFIVEYFVDGSPCQPPPNADAAFAVRNTSNPMLRICIGSIVVVCHFFTTEEIEFDIDPREVVSQPSFDELLGFLRKLGGTINKVVVLTYENDELNPIISYEPSIGEFRHHNLAA